jgi:hypothetical protein
VSGIFSYGVEERKGGIGVEATATATVLHPRTKFERRWEVGYEEEDRNSWNGVM